MEIAGHGDLLEYIKLRGAIAEEKAKVLFYQLVSAIEYLHSINIIHRYGQILRLLIMVTHKQICGEKFTSNSHK